jgi:hypothetical protein
MLKRREYFYIAFCPSAIFAFEDQRILYQTVIMGSTLKILISPDQLLKFEQFI